MIFLKKLPTYKLFLWIRTRMLPEEKLRIQLSKRGHSLDKAITENMNYDLFLFEVELILKEYYRRGLKSSELVSWAWDLVYRTKYNQPNNESYRDSLISTTSNKSSLEYIIKSRRSIRVWTEKDIDVDKIITAIDFAKWAPCSCNRQLWSFLMIRNDDDKNFIQIFTNQSFYKKAPIVIIPLINISEYQENERHYAYLDSGAITQNLLLMLHSEGLGACWMGIKKSPDISEKYKKFRNRFKINESKIPTGIIPVGYPKTIPTPPARNDTKDLIQLE